MPNMTSLQGHFDNYIKAAQVLETAINKLNEAEQNHKCLEGTLSTANLEKSSTQKKFDAAKSKEEEISHQIAETSVKITSCTEEIAALEKQKEKEKEKEAKTKQEAKLEKSSSTTETPLMSEPETKLKKMCEELETLTSKLSDSRTALVAAQKTKNDLTTPLTAHEEKIAGLTAKIQSAKSTIHTTSKEVSECYINFDHEQKAIESEIEKSSASFRQYQHIDSSVTEKIKRVIQNLIAPGLTIAGPFAYHGPAIVGPSFLPAAMLCSPLETILRGLPRYAGASQECIGCCDGIANKLETSKQLLLLANSLILLGGALAAPVIKPTAIAALTLFTLLPLVKLVGEREISNLIGEDPYKLIRMATECAGIGLIAHANIQDTVEKSELACKLSSLSGLFLNNAAELLEIASRRCCSSNSTPPLSGPSIQRMK